MRRLLIFLLRLRVLGGSAVIWSGLAAGSYTVEPAYRDNSVSSVTTFDGGGGAYGVASSSVAYTLLEIN